jgi:hypothetical protein
MLEFTLFTGLGHLKVDHRQTPKIREIFEDQNLSLLPSSILTQIQWMQGV